MVMTREGHDRVNEAIRRERAWRGGASISRKFSVPVDSEVVDVTLSRAKHAATIDVHDLDSLLVINPDSGIAQVESKEHRHRPFDMNTPMGTRSDLGPVWRRDATLEDVAAYGELLDRVVDLVGS